MISIMNNNAIENRKERWKSFYKKESQNTSPFMFIIRLTDPEDPSPMLWPEKMEERISWMKRDYYRQLEQTEWLYDDRVPFIDMISGTEIFAEAFGSPVLREMDNQPFALPAVNSSTEARSLQKPELMQSTLSFQFEMADRIYEQILTETDFKPVFRLPDIQTPMDIAALIWAKEDFFPAMIIEPDEVRRLVQKIQDLQFDFFDTWFSRYGHDFVAHYPEYYMPGGVSMSEDEIGAVSPAMFDDFFLPSLNAFSKRYGTIGIHSCADSQHQWSGFAKVRNLRVLNINQPESVLEKAYSFFKDSTILLPVNNGEEEKPASPEDGGVPFGGRGKVIYHYTMSDRGEARDLANRLNDLREGFGELEELIVNQ